MGGTMEAAGLARKRRPALWPERLCLGAHQGRAAGGGEGWGSPVLGGRANGKFFTDVGKDQLVEELPKDVGCLQSPG